MPKIEKFPAKISCNSQHRIIERKRGRTEKKDEIIRNFNTFFPLPRVDWVFFQKLGGKKREERE